MSAWIEFGQGWPDWQDSGKRIEAEYEDGSIVAGVLGYEDFANDGETEYPLWQVTGDDGSRRSFADVKRWRFMV